MSFPRLRQTAIALAASMMMVGLSACGGGSDDPAPTAPRRTPLPPDRFSIDVFPRQPIAFLKRCSIMLPF